MAKKLTYYKNGKANTLLNGFEVDLAEYDCSEKRNRLLSYVFYNSKGSVVSDYEFEDYETKWNTVVPESIGEMLLNKVCELF